MLRDQGRARGVALGPYTQNNIPSMFAGEVGGSNPLPPIRKIKGSAQNRLIPCCFLCPKRAHCRKSYRRGARLRLSVRQAIPPWRDCGFLRIPPRDGHPCRPVPRPAGFPPVGPLEDFHLQEDAPCRAHKQRKPGLITRADV